jgi:hypothetical protein
MRVAGVSHPIAKLLSDGSRLTISFSGDYSAILRIRIGKNFRSNLSGRKSPGNHQQNQVQLRTPKECDTRPHPGHPARLLRFFAR